MVIETYEQRVGPESGAKVVACAWTDPDFMTAIKKDCSAVIDQEFGYKGRQGGHINVVVCMLCSCYP